MHLRSTRGSELKCSNVDDKGSRPLRPRANRTDRIKQHQEASNSMLEFGLAARHAQCAPECAQFNGFEEPRAVQTSLSKLVDKQCQRPVACTPRSFHRLGFRERQRRPSGDGALEHPVMVRRTRSPDAPWSRKGGAERAAERTYRAHRAVAEMPRLRTAHLLDLAVQLGDPVVRPAELVVAVAERTPAPLEPAVEFAQSQQELRMIGGEMRRVDVVARRDWSGAPAFESASARDERAALTEGIQVRSVRKPERGIACSACVLPAVASCRFVRVAPHSPLLDSGP
jgi:hypothetical protein